FTPTLFIGAALGGGLGKLFAGILPGHFVHPAGWALVGMAGMVAGATRAPLTAIFIVFELTNDPAFVIPLMIVSVVAFATSRRFASYGLYDGWLAARGEHIAHGVDQALMDQLHVRDAMSTDVHAVSPGARVAELAEVAGRWRQNAIPVVDVDGSLVGIVGQHE